MAYDSTYLLNTIKHRAAIPQNQSTFTDQEILDVANEALSEHILPDILKARQEFYIYWDDLTPTKRASDNYSWLRIPERAVGQTVVDLCEPDDDTPLCAEAYWVENSKIYFDPDRPDAVRVRYYLRPGKLVETSACGTISTINTTTGEVVVTLAPSDFTTSLRYDLVRGKAGFDLLAKDLTVVSIVGTTITFTASDLPSELQAGDYVCVADESPVPQIPVEWFPYLAQHTASLLLESLGDFDGAKKVEARLGKMRENALSLISPRVVKKSKAIK
jgi:hypothetical protein